MKSRSKRRIFVRTTTKNKIRYEKVTPNERRCSECNRILMGIPRNTKKVGKSRKKINRKYGGDLCSNCSRNRIIKEVREWK